MPFDLEKILAFISGAGFSVFVAVWFMVKHDRRLDELTAAIKELAAVLTLMERLQISRRRPDVGGGGHATGS